MFISFYQVKRQVSQLQNPFSKSKNENQKIFPCDRKVREGGNTGVLSNSVFVLDKSERGKVLLWPLLKSHFLIVLCFYKKVFVLCYNSDLKATKENKTKQTTSPGHCIRVNYRKWKIFMLQRWNLRKGRSFEQRVWPTNNRMGYHNLLSSLVSICLHEKNLKTVIRKKQNAQIFPSLPVTVP